MSFFELPLWFLLSFLFVLGSCFGSFLNVCIYRFPSRPDLWGQLRSLNSHSSGCPRCSCAIRWHDNVPVLGWLKLLGRCRQCMNPISVRYPAVEALTGILFVVLYLCEVPAIFGRSAFSNGLPDVAGPETVQGLWTPDYWLHIRYFLHIALLCALISATFIDIDLKIIPDGTTIPVMLLALVVHTLFGQTYIVPLWFQDLSSTGVVRSISPDWLKPLIFEWNCVAFADRYPHLHGLLLSLAGLVVGGGIVWAVRIAGFWVLRQEAMGFGDVVLMAMIGSVIGWQPVTMVFFIAPVLAIGAAIFAWLTRRGREIPYGPYLSLATLLLLVFWKTLWPPARQIFEMGPMLAIMALVMCGLLVLSLQLVQLLKRLLGISLQHQIQSELPVWTSADHLSFYGSQRPDLQAGQWPIREWPGSLSGRGQQGVHTWKSAAGNTSLRYRSRR